MYGQIRSGCDGIDFPSTVSVIWTVLADSGGSLWPHKCVVKLEGPEGWCVELPGA